MTFTELEIVLFLALVVLVFLHVQLLGSRALDRRMTAKLLHAIAAGHVRIGHDEDGDLTFNPNKEAA